MFKRLTVENVSIHTEKLGLAHGLSFHGPRHDRLRNLVRNLTDLFQEKDKTDW